MNSKKNLKRNLLICLLAGSAVMYTLPLHAATSVIGNGTLPSGGHFVTGGNDSNIVTGNNGLQMDITQSKNNAVITWKDFNVGGSATVNFWGPENHNTLNYVNGGNMSQIYGTINANNNGNIFIVNPAGVQIGNSAQINVGSLYVSNKYLNENKLGDFAGKITPEMINSSKNADAVLMSLGNINANNVTFEGDGRIVIDSERIKNAAGSAVNNDFEVHTNDAGHVLIGYDAYNEIVSEDNGTVHDKGTYEGKQKTFDNNVFVNNSATATAVDGYMWVEDVEQLQAINTNLSGNYALRNSIDATSTEQNGFTFIGSDDSKAFTGNFDGIDYNIFGLTIKNGEENTGLFGYTNNATISNVTLVGGSITGKDNVGAIVGSANNTTLTNVVNSAAVSGDSNVGGIVGSADGTTVENAINTGTIEGNSTIETNVGGLIGEMKDSDTADNYKSQIIGNSYNLGDVSGDGYNVGGLVGHAVNSTIGDGTNLVYNRLDVTGAYNVGGIVGNMEGTAVQNAENSGTVTATGHTTENYIYHSDYTVDGHNKHNDEGKDDINGHYAVATVNVANVGGIAGTSSKSSIENVTNSGDVSSSVSKNNTNIFEGGNVGGVVGRAVDTNIKDATNRENEVRGAHNVGGVAGYFGGTGTVSVGINDGGDIMATGARNGSGFVKEIVRKENINNKVAPEEFTVGNIGGIVGYMYGDGVKVTGSANRGTVHTDEPDNPAKVEEWQKAANVGGIVGKIDSDKPITGKGNLDKIYENAAVSNSYNTGDVLGYTGIGGIAGMMYNGAIAGSYNLGDIRTTRQSDTVTTKDIIDPINMGGIVGDTTEQSSASVYLYDVYNKGKIGDETYTYFGRHVGGIVGRLSGTVEKAYNTGAIYNGYNVVGGIAGWMVKGSIKNSFNTGNITVNDKNNNANSEVGGIVGAADISAGDIHIDNVYNLGTVRSFKIGKGENEVGGIIGGLHKFYFMNSAENKNHVYINNAYTTGNLYAKDGTVYSIWVSGSDDSGANAGANRYITTNTYYIKPENELGFNTLVSSKYGGSDNSNKAIEFDKKDEIEQYQYDENGKYYSLTFTQQTGGDVDGGGSFSLKGVDENGKPILIKLPDGQIGDWRIYDGNTPILNAFLPNAEDYFDQYNDKDKLKDAGIGSIQYGTAYDPLLTIINAASGTNKLEYDWEKLGINNAAGIAVYGADLTLDGFRATGATGYFGGTIYADGTLNLKNDNAANINIGSAADIYGSSVNITTDGKVTIYGDVTATGNGTTTENNPDIDGSGSITINAGDVDVYGKLTSATTADYGNDVKIPGIEGTAVTWNPGNVSDPYAEMSDIADRFAHTTGKSNVNGNITINAGKDKDGNAIGGGNVNIYFGNQEQGLITTGGSLTVTGTGDVYVDSDLDIGGDMTLTSTGADSEVLLTLTNIGKVQADRFTNVIESAINGKNLNSLTAEELVDAVKKAYPDLAFNEKQAGYIITALQQGSNKVDAVEKLNNDIAVAYMHDFMHSFAEGTQNKIALNAVSGDAKLTVDMWVEDVNGSKFDFTKYDSNFTSTGGGHKFINELNNLNFTVNGTNGNAADTVYVEVSTGEQLKAIQNAGSEALGYNYALMGDINASDVSGYEAIGNGSSNGFTGTFDGRGNRIIGLNVSGDDAGIFSTVGTTTVNNDDGTTTTYTGTVKDLNIYSSTFTGTTTAGAVAGENNGRIEGIVTFGNTVTSKGNAGGIVGVNYSGKFTDDKNDGELTNGIYDVESTGSVIAGSSSAVAGGLVGRNDGGLANSFSDSAVTVDTNVTSGTSAGLGGVVGINNGNVQYVDSLGVTNGGVTGSSNIGGIIGTNNGNMYSGYNESIVSGKDNVGGIIGTNAADKKVENVVNATGVEGDDNVGGLVGVNSGSVTNGRNNGTITGVNYVGGMVGSNTQGATLTNLVNDSSAAIEGENYVGGIAGTNAGTITAQNQSNLINRGSITGQNYVGGVAGENIGTIEYVKNDVNLYVKDDTKTAQYFGGVAGINGRVDDETTTDVNEAVTGTITSATNEGDVVAENASYVGGIVGWNTSQGKLVGMGNSNEGTVIGGSYVGGVIGKNDAAIGSKGSAQVGITNEGTVIATKGGAGGLIAENNAAITNTVMINRGEVHGNNTNDGSGTGGLIGTNNKDGDITYSSLINEVTGTVTGTNNVGGLIGVNKADITGGRYTVTGEDAGMYINKIYNNGVINVGTYGDTDNGGDYEFTAGTGSNIGGLIGDNKGSLTAGYNTGAINASGSINVGGIAGSNAGTIDQVFNTVITADGKNTGTITGGTNVGGLVGNNSGTLSNAYNITGVTGNYKFGNAVGNNTGEITNIYASNTTGILIGAGYENGKVYNAYSFVSDDKSATGVITGDAQKDSDSYEGFDFDTDGSGIWKNYDGYSNPLLKVFLTKAYYDSATGQLVAAADDFKAHQNAEGGLIFQGGLNNLWSIQIRFGNGNPNWLGYDLEGITYMPDKNWYYFLDDAPFDRNRDFRERKAEVNFVDGGMEI